MQIDDLVPVRGYLSQGDPRLHFGLGKATKADKVQIRWPDGSTTLLADVPANQFLSVVQARPLIGVIERCAEHQCLAEAG